MNKSKKLAKLLIEKQFLEEQLKDLKELCQDFANYCSNEEIKTAYALVKSSLANLD